MPSLLLVPSARCAPAQTDGQSRLPCLASWRLCLSVKFLYDPLSPSLLLFWILRRSGGFSFAVFVFPFVLAPFYAKWERRELEASKKRKPKPYLGCLVVFTYTVDTAVGAVSEEALAVGAGLRGDGAGEQEETEA